MVQPDALPQFLQDLGHILTGTVRALALRYGQGIEDGNLTAASRRAASDVFFQLTADVASLLHRSGARRRQQRRVRLGGTIKLGTEAGLPDQAKQSHHQERRSDRGTLMEAGR